MGYEIIDAEEFFETKGDEILDIKKMERINDYLEFVSIPEKTLNELKEVLIKKKKESIGNSFNLEIKSTQNRYSIEAVYTDRNNFTYLDIYTIDK